MDTTATNGAIRAKGALSALSFAAILPPRLLLAHALCSQLDRCHTHVRPTNFFFVNGDGLSSSSVARKGLIVAVSCAQRRG